jgi:hypothetical protein
MDDTAPEGCNPPSPPCVLGSEIRHLNRSKEMRRKSTKIFIVAGSLLVAGLGIAGAASADDASKAAQRPVSTAVTSASADQLQVNVEHQRGIVLEGSGLAGDLPVAVTVYENSLHGNSIQVVLGDPDNGGKVGFVEQAAPFVVDGVLDAAVDVDGRTVELTGTVEETGRTTRMTEPIQDAGEQVVSKGTHTQLLTHVTLSVEEQSVALEFAPAFAYDLEIRKVALYGN